MRRLFLVSCLIVCLTANAQDSKIVSASYTFYAPETMSVEEAKRESLQRAQIEAIANEFGTIIGQNNTTQTRNENGVSHMDFLSLRWSDVKGEWIETIGQPKYDIQYDNHLLIVKCEVKGKAREITRALLDLITKPLKNGTDIRSESYSFKDGDDLYLYFSSPVDGYLSVYLLDEFNHTVYNILPYKSQNVTSAKIISNKEYIFFSKNHVDRHEQIDVDEYTLTSDSEREYNTLYVLFSKNEIGKKRGFESNEMSLPKNIPYVDFQSWLSKALSKDKNLQLIRFSITIDK